MNAKLHKIAIALGGNRGDTTSNFCLAAGRLCEGGVENIKFSTLFHSRAENCPPGSADFTNAALIGEWAASPGELLDLCQQTELSAGRPLKHGFNAPRPLDLDIILFGAEIINLPGLQIPHPRAARRWFVLEPLAELAPGWIFPDLDKTVKQLLELLKPCRAETSRNKRGG